MNEEIILQKAIEAKCSKCPLNETFGCGPTCALYQYKSNEEKTLSDD
ncbi:hypothetical protein [Photobacterium leiognathi]|nr:hypothetical protein [Photobacterium leiognathi]